MNATQTPPIALTGENTTDGTGRACDATRTVVEWHPPTAQYVRRYHCGYQHKREIEAMFPSGARVAQLGLETDALHGAACPRVRGVPPCD